MRILLTGAGGPSAVSVWKSLHPAALQHTLYMADMDACASGLYLVPEQQRLLVPRGDDPAFVDCVLRFCQAHAIELLISTVDAELAPLAQAIGRFEAAAVKVPLSPLTTLHLCRDKLALLERVKDLVPTPAYEVIDATTAARKQTFPLFAKPRISAGSRHATLVPDQAALRILPQDGSFLLQQWLPGDEYSVDVYLRADGQAVASVPRWRMKTDSGIAMAAQTVHDTELEQMAVQVCQAIGIRHVANVQFKRDCHGQARLLEINPRFPGTLPLTTQAGVDMPALMVAEMCGQPLPPGLMPFQELMAVRYLTEQFVSTAQWQQLKVPLNAWLARHGQSTANVGLPTPDADSIALTELGQAQAQALADSLPRPPDLLVISPLRRAIQTAAPILARWPHLAPETWPIQEINYLSTQRCANTTPLERRPWVDEYWQRSDPHYQDGADAESFAQFWQRVYQFHQRIAAYDGGEILVVGHGQFFHACLMLRPEMTVATPAIMQVFHRTERDNPLANGTRVAMPLPFSARTGG